MNRKTVLSAALAAGALMGLSSVAQAVPAVVANTPYYSNQQQYPVYTQPQVIYTQPQVIYTQPAPPAPIYEAVPAPREGWVWTPGFYDWRDGRYVWTSGRWAQERPGWAWQEARWLQRADGSWYLVSGQWVQSQQYGDRRGPDGDRDSDGVANRYDRFPRNPNRM
jgi:hypothetical protein